MAADRPPADPHGGRQGGRAGLRRAQPPGDRRSASSRSATAAFSVQVPTDDQATVLAAIDRLDARARHLARRRASCLADHDRDRRDGTRQAGYYTNRRRPRLGTRRPCPAGHLRLGGDRAADRRREQPAARPARGRAGRRRPRRPHLHGRHRQPAGTTLEVDGFKVHTAARRGDAPARSRTSPTARTTPPTEPDRLTRSTTTSTRASSSSPRRSRSRRCSPGAGLSCCCSVGLARLAGWLGRPAMTDLALAPWRAGPPGRSSPAARRSRWTLAARGDGGPARALLEPVARPRGASPGSSRLRRHLPFALFAARDSAAWSSRSPGRSADPDRARPDRRRSSSRSTSRAACARPTSQPNRLLAAEAAASSFIAAQRPIHPDRHRRVRRLRRDRPGARRPTRRSCSTRSTA